MKRKWKRLPVLVLAAVMFFGQIQGSMPVVFAEGGTEDGISDAAGEEMTGSGQMEEDASGVNASETEQSGNEMKERGTEKEETGAEAEETGAEDAGTETLVTTPTETTPTETTPAANVQTANVPAPKVQAAKAQAAKAPEKRAGEDGPFQVGDDYYDTLSEAVENATTGAEILVLKNADVNAKADVGDKRLTIRGEGTTAPVLSRASEFTDGALLTVGEGGSLKLENLVFDGRAAGAEPDFAKIKQVEGGYYTIPVKNDENDLKADAAMVESSGALEASGVTFQNSWSNASQGGGAVYVDKGSVVMTGCTFEHNMNPKGAGICVQGRASETDGSCTVTEARFENCIFRKQFAYEGTNGGHGGGVYAEDVGKVTFTGCEFTDNTVSHYNGGAACVESNAKKVGGSESSDNNIMKLEVSGCTFTGNTVGNDGYAISISCESNITGSTFQRNKGLSEVGSVGTVTYGPRKQVWQKKHSITDCTFLENDGGAAVLGDHKIYQYFTIEDCKFIGNRYSGENEKDYLYSLFLLRTSDTTVNNCEFTDNELMIFYCPSGETKQSNLQPRLKVQDSTFTGNQGAVLAETLAGDNAAEWKTVRPFQAAFEKCDIRGNTISDNAIYKRLFYLYYGGEVTFKNTTIAENKIQANGAGQMLIYVWGNDALMKEGCIPTMTLDKTSIQKNESNGYNVFVNRGKLTIQNGSDISCNRTADMGGGMGIATNATATVDATSTVHNNHSKVQGDDIVVAGTGGSLTIPEVGSQKLVLDDCGEAIDGWYIDTNDTTVKDMRYDDAHDNHDCDGVEKGLSGQKTYTVTSESAASSRYLKAAHGKIEEPEEPGTPEDPDNPDTPDNPDIPDTPDTPDNPDTPDAPDTPKGPDASDNPDTDDTASPDDTEVPDGHASGEQKAPQTGDDAQPLLWTVLCLAASGSLLAVWRRRRMR